MMAETPRSTRAGGFLLAASILMGVVIGSIAGQPSVGFLVGLAFGLAIAISLWLRDRVRRR